MHIPFCHRRCFYCDFPVVPLGDKASGELGPGSASIKHYLELLHREIELVSEGQPLSTVYIGGGTPSILSPKQIERLLSHLRNQFGLQAGAEITLEIDPASFTNKDLGKFIDVGINRVSLGAQSFNDNILIQLGRRHNSLQLFESCDWLSHAFKRGELHSWSIDLIQNLPGHSLGLWNQQLHEALRYSPPHLSVYDLSIEEGTVFSWRQKRGQLNLPNDDIGADITDLTCSILKEFGYSRYEISNFALPGHTSRHNRVYWSGAGWWGFGLGATSCPWGTRLTRPRRREDYENWLASQEIDGLDSTLVAANYSPVQLDDLILVGLRRREGVDFDELARSYGWSKDKSSSSFKELEMRWDSFIQKGWMKCRGKRFFLSDGYGMNFSNQVLVEMISWWESLPKDVVALPNS